MSGAGGGALTAHARPHASEMGDSEAGGQAGIERGGVADCTGEGVLLVSLPQLLSFFGG